MQPSRSRVIEKASFSIKSIIERHELGIRAPIMARAAGFLGSDPDHVGDDDLTAVLIEVNPDARVDRLPIDLVGDESLALIADNILSARLTPAGLSRVIGIDEVRRIQSKKESLPLLDKACADIGLATTAGVRHVSETGDGVVIGIVDSGFDLSHPAFRDATGGLRVSRLLDQASNQAFDQAALENGWATGTNPGRDKNGHGTHVASIAGGSSFGGLTGVAPDAKFVLVKTDWLNTDEAVKWIFDQAGNTPCVVNLSLGNHYGAHDGSDQSERVLTALVNQQPGRAIVASAGNEREDQLHIGHRFSTNETQTVPFDVLRTNGRAPFVAITIWCDEGDDFAVTLTTPTGQSLNRPPWGSRDVYRSSLLDIEISAGGYQWSRSRTVEIVITFKQSSVASRELRGWKLAFTCLQLSLGRLDAWIHNSGFGMFRNHPIVEQQRTIGMPATAEGCIAVASHVSKTSWSSDIGLNSDSIAVVGRTSPFSSLGPSRNGRLKPEISAPGQYLTAAMADQSEMSQWDERTFRTEQKLTIEGTSMSAPVVTGAIALMLQKKPQLTFTQIAQHLTAHARNDAHTGAESWNPAYGHGKLDISATMGKL